LLLHPQGPLHIGGVRTALFNWLFSKNQKGSFYLRIEDTDKERSRDEYKSQIIQSLKWIGIEHDDKEYIQSEKINEHKKVAEELLKKGFAYNAIVQKKRLMNKKIVPRKKEYPLYIIESGESQKIYQFPLT
jgi:glutamyl-tRNA synthetase